MPQLFSEWIDAVEALLRKRGATTEQIADGICWANDHFESLADRYMRDDSAEATADWLADNATVTE